MQIFVEGKLYWGSLVCHSWNSSENFGDFILSCWMYCFQGHSKVLCCHTFLGPSDTHQKAYIKTSADPLKGF